jgi:hypothetical protein
MAVISGQRATDERVKCLRIFADGKGETHMEDIDITLQPKKLFKDTPPTTPQRVDLDGVRVQQVEVAGRSAPPSEEGVILRYNVIKFYSPNQADSVVLGVR